MQRVIGGSTSGMEADDTIHKCALVEHVSDRSVFIAEEGHGKSTLCRRAGQCVAQRRVRIDEGCARQMEAHYLHQHLIGVCGPVEGAGARTVVGSRLRLEQRVTSDLAFGISL